MPQPAIQNPLFATLLALPAATPAASVSAPIRPGWRPYTEKTRGKRPSTLVFNRGLSGVVAPTTSAPFGIFGCDVAYDSASFGTNTSGQALAGTDPLGSSLNLSASAVAGCYVDTVRVSGGAGTGVGFIAILNPGFGYLASAPPAVTFTGLGAAAGTAVVSIDGRVVGITMTNIGTFAPTGVISIAAPVNGTTAIAAFSAGQVTTVNTRIPFSAHAPTTPGAAYWFATWKDRIIACSTGYLATVTANMGIDPDQHLLGISSAGSYINAGFTVASATHPDGTPAIGQLTLGLGVPNGAFIIVYRGLIRQVISPQASNGLIRMPIRTLDLMWMGGNATAGVGETSVITCSLEATSG